MQCKDYELHTCRDKIFDRLCEIWTETKNAADKLTKDAWDGDIWRKANTLQTVAFYWQTINNVTQKQKAMNLMIDGYNFYKHFLTLPNNIWVDDFGWWAGFFDDLRDYTFSAPLSPPFDQDTLLNEMKYCYGRMLKNLDSKEGGIWNHTDNGGEKNTVTNAWMLNVESNLFNLTQDGDYKTKALAQYNWLTTGNIYGQHSRHWVLYASDGTLLWLPGATGAYGTTNWTGDEGVFLRGLTFYMGVDPDRKKELLEIGQDLITAAMNTYPDAERVMHESANSRDWSNDLGTGKGVFMRLVTRFAIQHNFFEDQQFKEAFTSFVHLTAESVWCSRDQRANTAAPNWNCKFGFPGDCKSGPPAEGRQPTTGKLWPQVWQTDGLDALNAAFQIGAAA